LHLQGGPFNAEEITAFESSSHFADAVRLRHYDDIGKKPGARTPELEHYRGVLEIALRQAQLPKNHVSGGKL
jgi:predicted HD phosphohydrolase